jgi:hypothetical protein
MKKVILLLFIGVLFMSAMGSDSRVKDCKCKGKNLWGRVRVVSGFEDFAVRVVSGFPDLYVEKTRSPRRCGEWEFVDAFEDFSIKFVDGFEDFAIEYVNGFPGMR